MGSGCVHLIRGESDEWIQLPQPDGGEVFDYLCPACLKRDDGPENLPIDLLTACCFHCTRRMIEERGITPTDLDDVDC